MHAVSIFPDERGAVKASDRPEADLFACPTLDTILSFSGRPGGTRTPNQTVMSGRL